MQDEFDKNEKATPYKLQQARRRGQVARSPDLTSACVLLSVATACYAWGPQAGSELLALGHDSLVQALSMTMSLPAIAALAIQMILRMLSILAPFAVAMAVTAILGSVVQSGVVWSSEPLKPDMQRLNPATGFKRIFSLRTIYEAFKSICKVSILGLVLYWSLKHLLPAVAATAGGSAKDTFNTALQALATLALQLGFAALILAILDLGYTRFEFAKKMRMSRRDLKDEVKHREGDPRIRSRLRALRIEMLKKAATVQKIGQADVLVVNPTHLAVALKYHRGEMPAPELLAKGAGFLAARMRAQASRHGVPIVRNPPLARALYFQGEIGQSVPAQLYADVARVMVWVFSQRKLRETVRRAQ